MLQKMRGTIWIKFGQDGEKQVIVSGKELCV